MLSRVTLPQSSVLVGCRFPIPSVVLGLRFPNLVSSSHPRVLGELTILDEQRTTNSFLNPCRPSHKKNNVNPETDDRTRQNFALDITRNPKLDERRLALTIEGDDHDREATPYQNTRMGKRNPRQHYDML